MGQVKIVSASAGSGKTRTLALEYIVRVLVHPTLYRHILAVTFTNKATEEMKERILRSINDLVVGVENDFSADVIARTGLPKESLAARAEEVRNYILHDYDNFAILTIDKFFQRIVRAFVRELGIDVNYNLELHTDSLLDLAADRLIEDLAADERLREWIFEYVNERIDQSAKPNIKHEITKLGGELFSEHYKSVRTGANPRNALIKIVREAHIAADRARNRQQAVASELIDALHSCGLSVSELTQGARGVGGYIEHVATGQTRTANSYVLAALNDGRWLGAKDKRAGSLPSNHLSELLGALIESVEQTMVADNNTNIVSRHYRNFGLIIDLGKRIDSVCVEENIVPISEMGQIIAKLIEGNDAPFIFEKVGNRYSHYMIDEFQDTSALQWNNFLPLLQNAVAQSDEEAVLLVGDVKQSIYRWRGGDWSLLGERAEQEFMESHTTHLSTNYRSRKEVVEFNNALTGHCAAIVNTQLNRTLAEGVTQGDISERWAAGQIDTIARAYSDHTQQPHSNKHGYVSVTLCGERNYEVDLHPTIRKIIELQERGFRAEDIAVLVRTNSQSERVAEMLLTYKNLHPDTPYTFDVITQTALSVGAAEVCRQVIAAMKYATTPKDGMSLAIIKRLSGIDFDLPLSASEEEFYIRLRTLPLQEAFEEIVLHYGLHTKSDNHAYLQALHEQVINYSKRRIADMALFTEWWEESGAKESISMPSGANAITIVTVHKSKGLAYRALILHGCAWAMAPEPHQTNYIWSELDEENEGLSHFPVAYSSAMRSSRFSESYYRETVMSAVDSLNILYVALTRARDELHIVVPIDGYGKYRGIGGVVLSALEAMVAEGSITSPDVEPPLSDEGSPQLIYTYGTPIDRTSERASEQLRKANINNSGNEKQSFRTGFATRMPWEKLSIKFSMERYTEDNPNSKLHPLNLGVALHDIFSRSKSRQDVADNLRTAIADGRISPEEGVLLSRNIEEAMQDARVSSWFSEEWDEVRNEHQIVIPRSEGNRPDRVMIKGTKAVVVDYKFGLRERDDHIEQVRRYLELLSQMGYKNREGYIWYVTLNRVVEVE